VKWPYSKSRYNPDHRGATTETSAYYQQIHALIGVILTGYIAALAIRSAFWQSAHYFHWLLPLGRLLPAWPLFPVKTIS
jgi:hypothetical protein